MPERWEHELDELRHMEMRDTAIRERIERGPSVDPRSSRKNSLLAGIVAGAVAVAGIAALWQLDRNPDGVGEGAPDLPTLIVTFQSGKMIVDQPDEQIQRVDTTIAYGDAREEDFTSTISESAHVDWVGVEDLTRFVPGPTAGSQVRFDADGEDARVLIGQPSDWPEFDRFTAIDRLPQEPGDYVLVFEATYAEGVARTARFVHVVAPGELQIVAEAGGALDTATAIAYVDGRRSDGFLSTSWYSEGDDAVQSMAKSPTFADDDRVELASGSALALASSATEARAGLLEKYSEADSTSALPLDLLLGNATLDRSDGRYLLAVDVTWVKPAPGAGNLTTEERAFFYFPIEIVSDQQDGGVTGPRPSPSSVPSPSPEPEPSDGIVVSVFGLGERSDDRPTATFSFAGETRTACTQDFEWTKVDGTTVGEVMPDTSLCSGRAIEVPPGTSIAIQAATTTRVITTRTTTQFFEGDVGLVVSAEWPQGNATFVVPLTVSEASPDLELVVLDCGPTDQVGFTGPDARIEPGGSAYIVGNLPGFERGDVVEQMTRNPDGDTEWSGVWQVVRDGHVVASVDWDALSGTACGGSGIGGP
jgi:hypothetical protein